MKFFLLAALAVAALSLTSCGGSSASSSVNTTPPTPQHGDLSVGFSHTDPDDADDSWYVGDAFDSVFTVTNISSDHSTPATTVVVQLHRFDFDTSTWVFEESSSLDIPSLSPGEVYEVTIVNNGVDPEYADATYRMRLEANPDQSSFSEPTGNNSDSHSFYIWPLAASA